MSTALEQAQEQRLDRAIDRMIDQFIDDRLSQVKLAAPISPQAKVKLRHILKKYAKSPHPFRACVRDNMKRFGPGRTEAVCATLKDTIKGHKNWRGKSVKASEDDGEPPILDGETLVLLDAISEHDLQEIFLEARAIEEHQTVEATALLNVSGRDELRRWGADGEVGLKLAQGATS